MAELVLRPATQADSARLLAWRNDDETRTQSRQTDAVSETDHAAWLAGSLQNPNRHLLIAERDGVPVGTLRLDVSDGRTVFSWTIAPQGRGQGLGTAMLLAGVDYACDKTLPAPFEAQIRPQNPASQRMAAKAGFAQVGEAEGWSVWTIR